MARFKQRHYSSEKQILDKIDECKSEAARLNMLSESLEKESARLLKEYSDRCSDMDWADLTENDRNLRAVGLECKENALLAHMKARRVENVVLPALGEALSEFRTIPMIPIVGENHSVPCAVGPSKEWLRNARNIGKPYSSQE